MPSNMSTALTAALEIDNVSWNELKSRQISFVAYTNLGLKKN